MDLGLIVEPPERCFLVFIGALLWSANSANILLRFLVFFGFFGFFGVTAAMPETKKKISA